MGSRTSGTPDIRAAYERRSRRKAGMLAAGVGAVLLMGLYFTTLGVADTSFAQVLRALSAWVGGCLDSGGAESAAYKIVVLMRLPRIAMAVLAGAALAVSGVGMQAVTGNALVSPFTIGISAAAAFGASMCIVFGAGTLVGGKVGIVLCAFAASLLCVALVYGISKRVGMAPETIVLTGIALNYFFSALTSTVEFFAQEHRLAAVVHWTFGTFNGTTWGEVGVAFPFVVVCCCAVHRVALKLDAIASGDDELVRSLGIDPEVVRMFVGVASVLMTAAVISFTGVIGFVGLLAPHIARLLFGGDHRFLIPFSAVCGAMLLLAADAVGKTVLAPVSIPVGIVVSFLGVPLFIHLILSGRRRARRC